MLLAVLSPIIAQIIQLAVSRQREFLADASGAMLTRYPEGLAMALEKIAEEGMVMKTANNATAHLYISDPFGNPPANRYARPPSASPQANAGRAQGVSGRGKKISWLHKLFMTHPPLEERIKRLKEMAV